MNIEKIAAFSDGHNGGNPAGVALVSSMPSAIDMQRTAAEVGFSETVFAEMLGDEQHWRVRYFSPESEVPFCGHATIALGAAIAKKYGDNTYHLTLNDAQISVDALSQGDQYEAVLASPPTYHENLDEEQIAAALALFNYDRTQLSSEIMPARIHAGASHYVFALKSTEDLASMTYELDAGREFMKLHDLVTIMFVVAETDELFHARNAFASGGVLEDPATGAAAAAFSGYLRDAAWLNKHKITIIQGEDMGCRSIITAEFSHQAKTSIRVSGTTRNLN